MSEQKPYIVTLGELMLRLKSPGFERLLQSPMLEASFGGGEANVAISLSIFGLKSRYISAFPSNSIGQAAINFLHSFGVDTSLITLREGRMGTYFIEAGSGPRPSSVLYDRAGSVISTITSDQFDWKKCFKDSQWFHISGITPALSQSAADLSLLALAAAKKEGLKTSCDLNFRGKLWNYGKNAPEIMRKLIPFVDVIVANEEDIQNCLGIKIDQKIGGLELDKSKYESLANHVLREFTNVEMVAITLRESYSADANDWSAMLTVRGDLKSYFSKKYMLTDIVDRVGAGDSFAAGLLYGLISKMTAQNIIEFATAASALKHTIPGDVNRSTVEEVKKLTGGDSSGRVQR